MTLTCTICEQEFERPGARGPRPKFCSIRCKGVRDRAKPERKLYERLYRRELRASGKLREYEAEYNQRPEVKAKQRARYWSIYRDPFMDVPVLAPYVGHQWFDKVRELVGPMPDQGAPWADQWNDEMGEAVLAFLEGNDPEEGRRKARRDYNQMKYGQVYISQLERRDEDTIEWDRFIKQEPVEEVVEPIVFEVAPRIDWTKNNVRGLHAESRKGSRGPNRSHKTFRGHR